MTLEQKAVLAEMVQSVRIGGIHDTLAYIDEVMNCDELILSQVGKVYPIFEERKN